MTHVLFVEAHASDQPLRIASFEIPPYIIETVDGQLTGVFIEQIRQASKNSGIPVTFDISNWSRAQKYVKEGKADAIFPVVYTKQRAEWLVYPKNPVTRFDFSFFARKEAPFRFDGNMGSMEGLTVGKISNAKMHPNFSVAEASGLINVEKRQSIDLLALAVARRRIDAFVAPHLMGDWALYKRKLENKVKRLSLPVGTSNIFLALSKKSNMEKNWRTLLRSINNIGTKDLDKVKLKFPQ